MSYQATHPVEVGTFGRFRFGGKAIVEIWIALEELSYETSWWIGIYSPIDVLDWARYYHEGLLTAEEIIMLEKALL